MSKTKDQKLAHIKDTAQGKKAKRMRVCRMSLKVMIILFNYLINQQTWS